MKKQWFTLTFAGGLVLLTCLAAPAQACEIPAAGRCGIGFSAAPSELNGRPAGTYDNPYRIYQSGYVPGQIETAQGRAPYASNRCGSAYPGFPNAMMPPGCPQQPYQPQGQTPSLLTAGTKKTAEPAETNGAKGEGQPKYVVQKGDTLFRIAQKFDTSVEMLMVENRITDPTLLQIGQELTIPPSRENIASWLKNQKSKVKKVLNATLTAYTAGFESTGKTPSHPAYGITSSGTKVKANHTIAVDPNVIPMGSLVYIEGIGLRQAEDTGSAIKGARIDVYIPDLEQALDFGVKKNVTVYVLDVENRNNAVRIASAKP
jgi:3D (Asp-Asp-Asp) domain-containing protein